MVFCILKTPKGRFRFIFSFCETVNNFHFKNDNRKITNLFLQSRRLGSSSRPKLKIVGLNPAFCYRMRFKTIDLCSPIQTSRYFDPIEIFKQQIRLSSSAMENNPVREIGVDNDKKVTSNNTVAAVNKINEDCDDDVVTTAENNTSEVVATGPDVENIQEIIHQKTSDNLSPKNIPHVDKQTCSDENKEKDSKQRKNNDNKKYVPAGNLSKRALRKWKRKQRKGIEETGPLTTNPDPGYGSDVLSETEYYFENGLRKVYPYFHTFSSYVKGRWLGRTVLDVFTKEFHVPSLESLMHDIENGLLQVNNKSVNADYKLKFNDLLSHRIHRHENPVVGTKLEIIEDNEHVIVVNKPSSIPCHPCGRYRYNSIVFILGKEHGYSNLRNIYRLDRLTSGVLICAKTSEKTRELEDQILNKTVQKEYVCRVVGKFPDEEIEVDQPLECINHKISLWQVRQSGKPSKTLFKRLSYNGTSSIVQCFPLTGRTHQIRVHLQYLGHPILNDPLYSGEVWGPESAKGKLFKSSIDDKKIGEAVMKNHNIGLWVKGPNPLYESRLKEVLEKSNKESSAPTDSDSGTVKQESLHTKDEVPDKCQEPPLKRLKVENGDNGNIQEPYPIFEPQKWTPDKDCIHCKTEYIDPQPKDLIMYLHALSYKGPNWEYRSSLPDWAQPDWKDEQ